MIYIQLFLSFLKIGMFSFGGGLAMIPLISNEITKYAWMTDAEFIQIIGITEMTPGPIAVNAATFVGYQTGGIFGAIVATLGVSLPPLVIILSISKLLFARSDSKMMKMIFWGVKPVIVALITSAGVYIIQATVFVNPAKIGTLVIAAIIFLVSHKFHTHPIILIILAALMGWGWTTLEIMLS